MSNLDKLEEPTSLLELRDKIQEMLPRIAIPEMLLEIHERTGFAEARANKQPKISGAVRQRFTTGGRGHANSSASGRFGSIFG